MAAADDHADPRPAGQQVSIRANCKTFATTICPFGAVLAPNDHTGSSMQCWEDGVEDGEWLAVNPRGWPVTLGGRGETARSTWTFAQSSDPAKLVAAWFYGNDLRQGLRVQALRCDLMLTEQAIRIGMSVGNYPRKGPWLYSDDKGKVVELKSHCVYAAVLPFEDIEMIDGGKHYVEIHCGAYGLSMLGKIGRDASGGKTQFGHMDQFSVALVRALLIWCRASDDPAKQAAAQRLIRIDYAAGLARRLGTRYHFGSVRSGSAPTPTPAADLARSNELPAGERACRRLNCVARGVPTDTVRCPSCDHPTVLLGEYRDQLMAAPGVLYDSSYTPPPQPDNPTVSVETAGVAAAPETASAMGERTCARIRCDREGVRTDDERCAAAVSRRYRSPHFVASYVDRRNAGLSCTFIVGAVGEGARNAAMPQGDCCGNMGSRNNSCSDRLRLIECRDTYFPAGHICIRADARRVRHRESVANRRIACPHSGVAADLHQTWSGRRHEVPGPIPSRGGCAVRALDALRASQCDARREPRHERLRQPERQDRESCGSDNAHMHLDHQPAARLSSCEYCHQKGPLRTHR